MNKHIILINWERDKNLYYACLIDQDGDKIIDEIKKVDKDTMLKHVASFENKYNLHDETTIEYAISSNNKSELIQHKMLYEFMHKFIDYNSKK